jgi:hypothetical protein
VGPTRSLRIGGRKAQPFLPARPGLGGLRRAGEDSPPRRREQATLGHHHRAITEATTDTALRTHPPPPPSQQTRTTYVLDHIESIGVGRRATYVSGGGLCAGLCYVTLYALVIHLIGTKKKTPPYHRGTNSCVTLHIHFIYIFSHVRSSVASHDTRQPELQADANHRHFHPICMPSSRYRTH